MSVQQYSIFINNQEVDISEEDLSLSFNYQLADIQEPEKRKTNFSKSIVIPGTQDNNKLFNYIFSVSKRVRGNEIDNFTPDFNPNLKADIIIYKGSVAIFEGFCRLLDITINEKGFINYNINAIGELIDIFSEIKNKNLTDLDFSEYDHNLNIYNIKKSWDTSIIKNGSEVPFELGKGYVYPLINYGNTYIGNDFFTDTINNGVSKFGLENFFPAVYVKEYIDRIFNDAGFSYTSNFFQSERFKRLIIPYNRINGVVTENSRKGKEFIAIRSNKTSESSGLQSSNKNQESNIYSVSYNEKLEYIQEVEDPGNNYDDSLSIYSPPVNGNYSFTADTTAVFSFNISPGSNPDYDPNKTDRLGIRVELSILKQNQGGEKEFVGKTVNIVTLDNAAVQNKTETVDLQVIGSSNVEVDEKVFVEYYISADNGPVSDIQDAVFVTYDFTIQDTGQFLNKMDTQANAANTFLNFNSVVPLEIKQSDLLKDLITMFNLYITPSKDNPKNLIIEPYNDFYQTDKIVDWTDKIDLNKKINIRPANRLKNNLFKFSSKEDNKDFWLKKYKDKVQKQYGEYTFEINNDFVDNEKEIKTKLFAPSPLAQHDNIENLYMPEFIGANFDSGEINFEKREKISTRILFYGGVINTSQSFTIREEQPQTINEEQLNKYGYAGHVDNPNDPDFTLEWDDSNFYYFLGENDPTPNSSLYTEYYRDYIDNISSPNSKVLSAFFYLDPIDIFNLDFRKLIHLDGNNYILNKIESYNPFTNSSTKVELFLSDYGTNKNFDQGITKTKVLSNNFNPISVGDRAVSEKFNIVEGGDDEVRDISATTDKYIVSGGKNEVRSLSATSDTFILDGVKNRV